MKFNRAFTLLEVLVALAIFATTALALMKIAMNYTQSIHQNQLRSYASFVAMNVAADIKIEKKWLTGTATEEREEQGERWKVSQTAYSTISPDVQRIEIHIAHIDPNQVNNSQNSDQANGITSLSIFNYRQAEQGNMP